MRNFLITDVCAVRDGKNITFIVQCLVSQRRWWGLRSTVEYSATFYLYGEVSSRRDEGVFGEGFDGATGNLLSEDEFFRIVRLVKAESAKAMREEMEGVGQ